MYRWQWHRSKETLAAVACAAWRGAEQKKEVRAVNAMPCGQMDSWQDRDYEYIKVSLGIKIAKFPVEMELFPRKANAG